ncbi:MAG: beta-galactosidase [Bacteroidales bacterium]|jgi:beta-galactosidase/beta-glucuronidase|nr:beta-galactosidase [Bacteroidales bacterium]
MKRLNLLFVTALLVTNVFAQWQPAGDKIKTSWAEEIDVENVLPEYPRPMMERADWKNLNGLWEYAITDRGTLQPSTFEGDILVPFALESSLSGVMKTVGANKELWYKRTFKVPSTWKKKKVLLHFGAVDWKTDVWVNDILVGTHKGGFTPFSFDVTPFLNKSGDQKVVLKVWDPTDEGYQPRGKQVKGPNGIWYTPVTGIWQTVWLEPVADKFIKNIRSVSNIDNSTVAFNLTTCGTSYADYYEITVYDGDKQVAQSKSTVNEDVVINIPNQKLWDTENPFLYDTKVKLFTNGKLVDQVEGYFAMRKVSKRRDSNGIVRIQLNNKDQFQFGPLDQGWWPDGLYTAPSDEALKYDIVKTKDFGYNMIRKHVKVEPARWYTHCDKLGILVWQDMPNGDAGPNWDSRNYFKGPAHIRSAESEANFRREWKDIMDLLYSHPSIVVWVPFNESWGQFKTVEIVEWTKDYDASRLVNPASGGNHFQCGDILDLHNYPGPDMYLYDAQRVTVLGEYGGIGLALDGHLWKTDQNWGYVQFKDSKQTTDKYIEYGEDLLKQIKAGFSAAVYTQTTDVEGEINGFMTYDRKVIKIQEERARKINLKIVNSLD